MPLYDCGDQDCEECQRAFGPDRRKAIENYRRREAAYAALAAAHKERDNARAETDPR